MIERERVHSRSGKRETETVYGMTSLSAERADAARLLCLVRGHWHIENKSHYVRDVTYDEDRSQVRSGNIPQVMAALRNACIGLMRLKEWQTSRPRVVVMRRIRTKHWKTWEFSRALNDPDQPSRRRTILRLKHKSSDKSK